MTFCGWVDHILALQQSLAHYERLLGQSHPAYLTQLRFSVSSAKSGSDKAVVQLTTISLGVLCVQTLIGTSGFRHHLFMNLTNNLLFVQRVCRPLLDERQRAS